MESMDDQKMFSESRVEKIEEALHVQEVKNPFAYDEKANWSAWELIKCIIGIVVVPIRLIIAVLALVLLAVLSQIAVCCGFDPNKPMSTWRKCILSPSPILIRIFLFAFGYYRIKVTGKRDKTASVVVGVPHSTFMDSWVIASQIGMFSGLGKAEAQKTPLFGSIFKAMQMVPVERSTPEGRKQALDEFVRRVHSPAWGTMLVFPEGTCTNRTSLIQFKQGAFVPGAPVQVILLRWPYNHFDPTWTSSSSRIVKIMRLLTQVYNSAEIEFLPVYAPGEAEISDPHLFARNVRQMAANELKVPITEHSYEDSFFSMAARKKKLDPERALRFEFSALKKLFHLDLGEAKRLLKLFYSDEKVKASGEINVEQFAKALAVPLTEQVIEFFSLLDQQDKGTIDFRKFLIGLSFAAEAGSVENSIDIVYEILDPENTGQVTRESLQSVLSSMFRKVDDEIVEALYFRADPDNTGFVDRDGVVAFLRENPELVLLSIESKKKLDKSDDSDRKLTVFTLDEANKKLGVKLADAV